MVRSTRRSRSRKGSLLVELACSGLFLFIFAVLGSYLTLLLFCAHITDRAARDACRAVAETPPQTTNALTVQQADKIANAILATFKSANPFMTPPALQGDVIYNDYGGNPPAQTSPSVTVTVVSTALLPFAPESMFGASFGGQSFTFSQTYTFPIINLN